ncbi:CCCH-type zinc finger protein with ARM repeat domain-containing protein [Actinidia rufa]|uniref:CCCH-type zinc finger protein with ARM repeat domain-containing protein n=1 Tax=Actinidia rufa TaxID=165716 RepID=A0A7J0FWH6_9ERIC|nr:CCCH-type zinc finger protein with ARM repeat domain-containing protein [Actinidia rufa]
MCSGPEQSKSASSSSPASVENNSNTNDMTQLTVDTSDSFSSLLELAANNDFEGFKLLMEQDPSPIDGVGLCIDVLKLILSQSEVDVNLSCGFDKSTALHCAASGGSVNAVDVVKLLLSAGADPNSMDAGGLRPVDVIVVSPKLLSMRAALEELLANSEMGLRVLLQIQSLLQWEPRSGVSSPRSNAASASAMDMAAALNLLPGSPSSLMSPSPFNQPMSPSGNGISHSSMDFDAQNLLNDLACFSQTRSNSASLNRSCLTKTLTPSNLEELFSAAEIASSPRYSDQTAACGVFSPSHKSAVLSQFQQQQNILSPINTNVFSPKNVERPLLQASFGVSSPRGVSPRGVEPICPMSARLSVIAQREKPVSATAQPQEEPDLSWVQSLVKESPSEMKDNLAVPVSGISSSGEAVKPNSQVESVDHSVLGAWLEQMQLDQLVA